jgi:TRAP-type C4-dicarboxylate transport system substrate-binding protein
MNKKYIVMSRSSLMKKLMLCIAAAVLVSGSASLFGYNKRANGVMEISLSSPIPANTDWGKALAKIAEEWKRVTNGEVILKIFANAVLGDEGAVIQQMDSGALDAAVLSTFGLNMITKKTQNIITKRPSPPSTAIMTLSCPFLIRDEEELDLVLRGLKPDLEAKINEKGYFTLAWARVGWAKVFARSPVRTPSDLQKVFLGTAAGEDELKEIFEKMGFKLRVVEQKSILQALTTRTIEAVYQSPIAAGGAQIVGVAPNMLDLNIAPFMGGIIFNQKTWEDIPAKHKEELLRVTKVVEASLDKAIKELETSAITLIQSKMKGRFKVIEPTPQEIQQWHDMVNTALFDDPRSGRRGLVGTTFDAEIYHKVDAIVKAHRGEG